MNPGEMEDKISVLELVKSTNTYAWEQNAQIWAKAEQLTGNNIFSQVGMGVKSVKFIIRRKASLTLHNAFRWKGKHCFLTDIKDIDRMYYEITAALVEPKICTLERTAAPEKDELNRPVYNATSIITYPGCLVEKYMGHSQENPMVTTESRYVLVTPKPIEMKTGELVTIGNKSYTVIIIHSLDEYKNEYEIVVKEDA